MIWRRECRDHVLFGIIAFWLLIDIAAWSWRVLAFYIAGRNGS